MKNKLLVIILAFLLLAISSKSIAMPIVQNNNISGISLENKESKPIKLNRSNKPSQEQLDKKIESEARAYEVVLITKMLEDAFPKGEESMLFGGGHGNDILRSMILEEYAGAMVDAGGVGLKEGIAKEILILSGRKM